LIEIQEEAKRAAEQAQKNDIVAEEIYSKHRAEWRKKHEEELQMNGVKGELQGLQKKT